MRKAFLLVLAPLLLSCGNVENTSSSFDAPSSGDEILSSSEEESSYDYEGEFLSYLDELAAPIAKRTRLMSQTTHYLDTGGGVLTVTFIENLVSNRYIDIVYGEGTMGAEGGKPDRVIHQISKEGLRYYEFVVYPDDNFGTFKGMSQSLSTDEAIFDLTYLTSLKNEVTMLKQYATYDHIETSFAFDYGNTSTTFSYSYLIYQVEGSERMPTSSYSIEGELHFDENEKIKGFDAEIEMAEYLGETKANWITQTIHDEYTQGEYLPFEGTKYTTQDEIFFQA